MRNRLGWIVVGVLTYSAVCASATEQPRRRIAWNRRPSKSTEAARSSPASSELPAPRSSTEAGPSGIVWDTEILPPGAQTVGTSPQGYVPPMQNQRFYYRRPYYDPSPRWLAFPPYPTRKEALFMHDWLSPGRGRFSD